MKKNCCFLLVIFAVTTIHAQVQWGIRAGGNMSSILIKDDGKYDKVKLQPGFHVGGTADISLSDNFSIQPGLLFSTKGCKADKETITFGLTGDQTIKINAYYLELPVNAIFKPQVGNGRLLVGAGPYVAYGLGGKWKATDGEMSVKGDIEFLNDYKDTESDSSFNTNSKTIPYAKPFDFGVNALVGYQFSNNFYFQLNGQMGLIDIDPSYNGVSDERSSLKTIQFGLSVGYKF